MAGRYVHRFGSRQGFEGAIVGIWAYQDENGTYRMALQVGLDVNDAIYTSISCMLQRHAQLFVQGHSMQSHGCHISSRHHPMGFESC
jgi:hypothetical protein